MNEDDDKASSYLLLSVKPCLKCFMSYLIYCLVACEVGSIISTVAWEDKVEASVRQVTT